MNTNINTKKIQKPYVSLGCDPEFFFEKKGDIIGSEKVIDIEKGINALYGKVICDGVQVEINPTAANCRQTLAHNIGACLMTVYSKMQADPELKTNFKPTVEIKKAELDTLAEKSKIFGCAPSKTVGTVKNEITVDPKEYMYRSAGGHIHIGKNKLPSQYLNTYDNWGNIIEGKVKNPPYSRDKHIHDILDTPERLVPILDIIIGNTCVLIDRNEGNIERRKVYGRAGEHRTPKHGLEYRTLSNFWLHSYPLMSFVMSLTRFAVGICVDSTEQDNYEQELLSLISMEDIHKAINENDFDLALSNFNKIKSFIETYSSDSFPLNKENLHLFEYFYKKGIDHWFPEDAMTNWRSFVLNYTVRAQGWENFLLSTVKSQYTYSLTSAVKKIGELLKN